MSESNKMTEYVLGRLRAEGCTCRPEHSLAAREGKVSALVYHQDGCIGPETVELTPAVVTSEVGLAAMLAQYLDEIGCNCSPVRADAQMVQDHDTGQRMLLGFDLEHEATCLSGVAPAE